MQVRNAFGSEHLKLRLFRAKYDVSRSQTVSSSRLLFPSRAAISDFSAEYISYARRGSNVQLLADWHKRIQGQLVVGDSVQYDKFNDAIGGRPTSLDSQNFAIGGRLRVSPFSGWEDDGMTETYFGHGQHLTLGAGYFNVSNINFTAAGGAMEIDRSLTNFDVSFHYGPLSLIAEYFMFDGMLLIFPNHN